MADLEAKELDKKIAACLCRHNKAVSFYNPEHRLPAALQGDVKRLDFTQISLAEFNAIFESKFRPGQAKK